MGYRWNRFVDFVHANGDFIEWHIEGCQPGKYTLSVRYALGSGGERPLYVSVNGKQLRVIGAPPPGLQDLKFVSTGGWRNWEMVSLPGLWLSAGTNTIRLTAFGFSGPNIDEAELSFGSTRSRYQLIHGQNIAGPNPCPFEQVNSYGLTLAPSNRSIVMAQPLPLRAGQ